MKRQALTISLLLALLSNSNAASPVDALLQTTWLMVDQDNDEFSGFPLAYPGGKAFITAHHGPSIRESCSPASFEPSVPASRPALGAAPPIKLVFRPTSSRECNYHHDAVLTAAPPGQTLLDLQPSQDPLRLREKLVIAGYPGKRFRAHECTLAGVRPSLNQPRLAHYVLECPSVNYDIGGMSGGPVIVLRTGKVIGFVNAQGVPGSSGFRRIYVTPLSNGTNGGLEFGIRHFMSSVDCFNMGGMPAGTCTVEENGAFANAPGARRR